MSRYRRGSAIARFLRLGAALPLVLTSLVVVGPGSVLAASPASGTIGPSGPTVEWNGTAPGGSSPQGEETCVQGANCDAFALTVGGTPGAWTGKQVRINITWLSPSTDYDVVLHKGGLNGAVADQSGNGVTTSESVTISPSVSGTGLYTVNTIYFAATAADQYHGQAVVESVQTPPPPPPASGPAPRYQTYVAPPALGNSAGEPTLGANTATGNIMYIAGLETLRVGFDDCSSPAKATWKDVSAPNTSIVSLDPILWMSPEFGASGDRACRTIVSQLAGKASLSSFTDDDGDTYTPSQGSGINSGVDHQNIGGGRYADPAPPHTFPYAVYYCSQDIADANCALSVDGGLTYGPAVPIYTALECGGLHGHIKVAPNDGTAYVPNKGCPGFEDRQAVVASTNNGLTWAVRPIPDSTAGNWDPSVDIGRNGKVYFGYSADNGHAMVATSSDRGVTWSRSVDVGAAAGIQDIAFPAMVAGDNDRAALAFLGTTSAPGAADAIWHLYVAHTYDGGTSWVLTDTTPDDPVQRGTICSGGISCGNDRNLLDFMDAVVDERGRVLVGYADGCIDSCVVEPPNSFSAKASIARQSGGRGLYAAFDPSEPTVPGAPRVTGTRDADGIHLTWPEPDNGGSPITGYRISRSTSVGGPFTSVATVTQPKYDDTDVVDGQAYFYRVRAINAVGASTFCQIKVGPNETVVESPCAAPYITILEDGNDDFTLPVYLASPFREQYDIKRISVGEPFFGPGVEKLVFTLKVDDLGASSDPTLANTLSPSTQWPIYFTLPDGTGRFVEMRTNAAGTPSFKYGNVPVDATASDGYGPQAAATGDLDTGSGYSPDGTITLIITNDKLDGPAAGDQSPQVGEKLTRFLTRISVSGPTPDNAPDSLAPAGSYTLRGNAFCKPNNAPTALLTAVPQQGTAPLTVEFSGAGSTDPDGDDIREYRFNFGDGSPIVTQINDPTVTHTYTDPGEYRATLTVKDDRGMASANESFLKIVVRAAPGGEQPSLAINDVTRLERDSGTRGFVFTVTRSGDTSQPSAVRYKTTDGTATAPGDYVAIPNATLSFGAGQTSRTITVQVKGDTVGEANETFFVDLSQATGATISDARGKGTITNDDGAAGGTTLSINDVRKAEGDTGTTAFSFTITRSGDTSGASSVHYRTRDQSANHLSDYTKVADGVVSFAAGETTKRVTISVNGDEKYEKDETFLVELSQATGASISDGQGLGTIVNDDPRDPVVVLTKTGLTSAAPGATFRYTLSYENLGPFPSDNARITDPLPTQVAFVRVSTGGVWHRSTRTVTWSLGTVGVSQPASVWVKVRVKQVPSGTLIVNRADFTGDLTTSAPAFATTRVE